MTQPLSPWLAGAGLPARWAGAERFVVLDTECGAGEHFVALWRAWQADPERPRRLFYLALAGIAPAPPCASLPAALRAQWPSALPGFHRLLLDDGAVVLDVLVGPPAACLAQIDAAIDVVIDPARGAPAVAPAALVRLLAPGATVVAPPSRQPSLTAAGFVCAPLDEERIGAVYRARQPTRAGARGAPGRDATERRATERRAIERRAIVLGAGLAGTAACERLCARGWHVTLIERHAQPAQEASGNLAGIFMPQLSRDDNPATRLSRAGFLFALRYWDRLGGIAALGGAQCGVLQLARDEAHGHLQRELAAAARYPSHFARWLESDAAVAALGPTARADATAHGGWLFPQGGWAHPGSLCRAMLAACGPRLRRCFGSDALQLRRVGFQWQVLAAGGAVLAEAPVLILANGAGATGLSQAAQLPLAAVRGQVTHLAAANAPALDLVLCREAYLTPPVDGVVSVGATYDADQERALRPASQHDNLARLAAMVDGLPAQAPLAGRVGFRCVAPDRLPLVGALPDPRAPGRVERLRDLARWPDLYGLLGYASRGLTWAPLAAELLACQLEGEPPPLEAALVTALDPGRFLLKQRRRLTS
ncbi:MAG: FAD-dependent 5-carboxymethylaminomethyl-2-thiouridine(34) oxidoreductase MnmC [Pseudomonadota bacterium]